MSSLEPTLPFAIMPRSTSATVPIIPLHQGAVLLPGITQRVPVSSSRPDLPALLSAVFTRAGAGSLKGSISTVPVACVPQARVASLMGPGGRLLIENGERDWSKADHSEKDYIKKADLFSSGVAAKITGVEGRGTGEFSLLVEGLARVKVDKIYQIQPHFEGRVSYHVDEVPSQDKAFYELFQTLRLLSKELVAILRVAALLPRSAGAPGLSPILARRLDFFIEKKTISEAGLLADFMANVCETSFEEKLQVLSLFDVKERVRYVIELLERQVNNIKNSVKITSLTKAAIPIIVDTDQDEQDLNRKAIRPLHQVRKAVNGLGIPSSVSRGKRSPTGHDDDDEEPNEIEELQRGLEAAKLSPEAARVAAREIKRLKKMNPAQADYSVTRTYLETLADVPWTHVTEDRLGPDTLTAARKQLDDDHYGLDKVKKRLLEYLAVLRLKKSRNEEIDAEIQQAEEATTASESGKTPKDPVTDEVDGQVKADTAHLETLRSKRMMDKSPILLLLGPPGVGKTSIARSLAVALGRKFHRISLGGVRDEAEIRGHRRTYVAAMPGLIVQGLRKVGVANPVFLLDEIDKLGHANFQGDPSAAMLEVLDPEQNNTFTDHYVNLPLDLSKVLFIATANSLDTIPAPLLDRMETIYLPGYTTLEKRHIATEHLIPKQIRVNGLEQEHVKFPEDVVTKIIDCYTREAGVRNLEREIGSVVRAKAVEYADSKDNGRLQTYKAQLSIEDVENILGVEQFEEEIAEKTSRPGIVTGLVAYSSGGNGSILFIEVQDFPGNGSVQLTGNLQNVLKESVEVALTVSSSSLPLWPRSRIVFRISYRSLREFKISTGQNSSRRQSQVWNRHCVSESEQPRLGHLTGVHLTA